MLSTAVIALALGAGGAGVYTSTKHGDPGAGAQRLEDEPRGECTQCHDPHASRDGAATGGPFPFLLFAPNDNALCQACHDTQGAFAVYPGSGPWGQSAHALSPSMTWPGPDPAGRPSSDAGKCVNCHDPHGTRDASGLVLSLAHTREEGLCLPCHDGAPGANVRAQLQKSFTHPIARTGRHDASEGSTVSAYANRHAECTDCHNPHRGETQSAPSSPPDASERLRGVGRVKVTNGPAGTKPVYTWAGPDETAFASEYELCFKCHSSWTTRPVGQPDLALLLNPQNPSFHPVEAQGRNAQIDAEAFVNGWSWDRMVYCSDCHGGDGTTLRGPHGSSHRHLLKGAYAVATAPAPMSPTDLCFDCHAWNTYAASEAEPASLRASRFNPPAEASGHVFHVARQGFGCYACHQSHGSTQLPGLIATGRSPGLTGYAQTPTGGTCTTTCHGARSYALNYPR